ncbi:MAG: ATP-binding protein [Bacteroidetes bacterium]|nr:ATP-binding protein [Bacteroidota bacterium]
MIHPRFLYSDIVEALENNSIVALIGPRQCGKSTLVKQFILKDRESVYLDLERPSDLARLNDPEWYLQQEREKLICIDEVQRKPDLFPVIRSLTDDWNESGKFLILGSASPDLLRQSSESLAGRITYKRLTPFLWDELQNEPTVLQYLLRGGFPRSYLATSNKVAFQWCSDFITTFIERDMKQWFGFQNSIMRRLITMLACNNGQTINYSSLANSLDISHATVRNYVDMMTSLFIVEVIPPFYSNRGKRLVKSPKIYISDSGLANALLGVSDTSQMISHPGIGALWESAVLAVLKGHFPTAQFSYYRTSNGAECDFVMEYQAKKIAVECKAGLSPVLSKGNYFALEDIKPDFVFVVAPIEHGWGLREGIRIVNLSEIINVIAEM